MIKKASPRLEKGCPVVETVKGGDKVEADTVIEDRHVLEAVKAYAVDAEVADEAKTEDGADVEAFLVPDEAE